MFIRFLTIVVLLTPACGRDATYARDLDTQSEGDASHRRDVLADDLGHEAHGDPKVDTPIVEDVATADAGMDMRADVPFDLGEDLPADARTMDAEIDVEDDVPPPIEAPADTWTWVDIPGTQCADGSPTGMGINIHPGATKLYIYLEGGGACWNYDNCFGLITTALHLDGFDAQTFESIITDVYLNSLAFQRDDAKNVLRDAHYVFLPYCTADIFAGDAVVEMESAFGQRRTIHFKGRENMAAYLQRLSPTFPDVEHVIIAGSSAGGFGAAVSWPAVRAAFPGRRVDVIDDSGPPVDPADGLWEDWVEIWNLDLPGDCDLCGESVQALRNYFRRYLREGDGSRMALLSYARDGVISTFMSLWPGVFEERLRGMCDEFGDEPNVQCFLARGGLHTFLLAGLEVESGGLPLWRWLELMIEGDEDWDSALP